MIYAGDATEEELSEQEDSFIIEWPEFIAEIPDNCQAIPLTKVSFLGGSQLGEDWRLVDTSSNVIEIDTQSEVLKSLTSDVLVLVTIKSALVDPDLEVDLFVAELSFAIKF